MDPAPTLTQKPPMKKTTGRLLPTRTAIENESKRKDADEGGVGRGLRNGGELNLPDLEDHAGCLHGATLVFEPDADARDGSEVRDGGGPDRAERIRRIKAVPRNGRGIRQLEAMALPEDDIPIAVDGREVVVVVIDVVDEEGITRFRRLENIADARGIACDTFGRVAQRCGGVEGDAAGQIAEGAEIRLLEEDHAVVELIIRSTEGRVGDRHANMIQTIQCTATADIYPPVADIGPNRSGTPVKGGAAVSAGRTDGGSGHHGIFIGKVDRLRDHTTAAKVNDRSLGSKGSRRDRPEECKDVFIHVSVYCWIMRGSQSFPNREPDHVGEDIGTGVEGERFLIH